MLRVAGFSVVLTLVVACGSGGIEKTAGIEGGPCYGNGTCNSPLVCNASQLCVQPTGDPCDGVTCAGHGSCSVISGDATCTCYNGYHAQGLACVADADPCAGQTCSDHGTCAVFGGNAACTCDNGYHADGLACVADAVDPCAGQTCSNHGTCTVNGGTASCTCDDGFHAVGLACVADTVDPCAGQTCSNHGTCAVSGGNAACTCDNGYHADGLACVADDTQLPACTKTIGPAEKINSNVGGPGSVLCLESGVYNQVITVNGSGAVGNPITIRAAPGASPIIDGQNNIPGGEWDYLVELSGDYIEVDGLEIRNSGGQGVGLIGTFNKISHSRVHHTYQAGILAIGDDNTIEYNEVWEAGQVNVNGSFGDSGWPCAIEAARDESGDGITNRAVIRGNISHDNWGEGVDSYEAEGTLIEGNIIYNNWSVNLYISDSRNVIARNNLVYNAGATGGRGGDLTMADEVDSRPRSNNVVVTNNFLYDATICVACWTIVEGLSDIDANHNTIVKGNVEVDTGNGSNLTESMNCILSANQVPGLGTVTAGSLTFASFAGASCPAGTGAVLP